MVVRLDVWRLDEIDLARIDDDEARAFAEAALHVGGEDRVRVGGIRADDHDHVGSFYGVKILGAGRRAESCLHSVSGGRMADAGAGVRIVVAEGGADHFLDQVGFFVRAARRGDSADRVTAVFGLDALEFAGGVLNGFVPSDFAPGIGEFGADHRLEDTIFVSRVAVGETALHAGVAVVGLAFLVGRHANDFVALQFGVERAAHAAIGAGGNHAALGVACLDDGFLQQGVGGAGLHAGAAGDALRFHERLVACGNGGSETATVDRESESPLYLFAGAHAARADDAFGLIEFEIGIGIVLFRGLVILAFIAVADFLQADGGDHLLEFGFAAGRVFEHFLRVVGSVQLHDAEAKFREPVRLRADLHALLARSGAGSG